MIQNKDNQLSRAQENIAHLWLIDDEGVIVK